MIRFIQEMSTRMQEYERRLKSGLFDAKEKIIHHLEILREKNQKGFLRKLKGPKETHITHETLAQHTGLSRETVTRAITDLKKSGDIATTESGKIVVR